MSDEKPLGFLEYLEPTCDMHFGQALAAMKAGKRVRRVGWMKRVLCLSIQAGELQLCFQQHKKQVWHKAGEFHWFIRDILATDWSVVP